MPLASASAPVAPSAVPLAASAAVAQPNENPMIQPRSSSNFEDDVAFLAAHGAVKVLTAESGGRIAVSPVYQGRVMTSAVGAHERSLGFINKPFINEGKTGTQFDNYGGEDRFWLGPEGGQFGLYFAPKAAFTFDQWQTPHGLQEGAWDITKETPTSVALKREFSVTNYQGKKFDLEVEREVALITPEHAADRLGLPLPEGVRWVGFSTTNQLKNAGKNSWHESEGLLSIWILGMFAPVPGTRVIIPFDAAATGEVVNDRYFGKVPADRLVQAPNYLLFTCDGEYRSKIGLGPTRAKSALGSYSEPAELLTLVLYTKPAHATRYVNSMWETQKEPFHGDVINSYNDGPPAPGKPSLGGFYEIESSSPALALAPGQVATHEQQTYHFTGPRAVLDQIARKVLGVSLAELPPTAPRAP